MSMHHTAHRARARVLAARADKAELDVVLKALPSAVRRMGLVRCLEWLDVGKKARGIGPKLHEALAPDLLLHPSISRAVEHLETCPRRDLFRHQRLAVELFDALAIIQRIEGRDAP